MTVQIKQLPEDPALLVRSVIEHLEKGAKHYNEAGKLLITCEEIIQTLCDEGKVTVDIPYDETLN